MPVFEKYRDFFENPIEFNGVNTAWLAFPILITKKAKFSRRDFQIFLEKREIQTRVVFTGNVTKQPMCNGINFKVSKKVTQTDSVMERGVLLPLHHGMT